MIKVRNHHKCYLSLLFLSLTHTLHISLCLSPFYVLNQSWTSSSILDFLLPFTPSVLLLHRKKKRKKKRQAKNTVETISHVFPKQEAWDGPYETVILQSFFFFFSFLSFSLLVFGAFFFFFFLHKISLLLIVTEILIFFWNRMMSDYKVEMINDGMQEFYVHFHGPSDSKSYKIPSFFISILC